METKTIRIENTAPGLMRFEQKKDDHVFFCELEGQSIKPISKEVYDALVKGNSPDSKRFNKLLSNRVLLIVSEEIQKAKEKFSAEKTDETVKKVAEKADEIVTKAKDEAEHINTLIDKRLGEFMQTQLEPIKKEIEKAIKMIGDVKFDPQPIIDAVNAVNVSVSKLSESQKPEKAKTTKKS